MQMTLEEFVEKHPLPPKEARPIRAQLDKPVMETLVSMAEGNPGAATVLAQMLMKDNWYAGIPSIGFMYMLTLDEMGIYGSHIWMLFNDCCKEDWVTFETVMRNRQYGHLSEDRIRYHVMQGGYGLPFTDLVPLEQLFQK